MYKEISRLHSYVLEVDLFPNCILDFGGSVSLFVHSLVKNNKENNHLSLVRKK
jgi:hypothetical protein